MKNIFVVKGRSRSWVNHKFPPVPIDQIVKNDRMILGPVDSFEEIAILIRSFLTEIFAVLIFRFPLTGHS